MAQIGLAGERDHDCREDMERTGHFTVTVEARCAADTSYISIASAGLSVTMTETVTTPAAPAGPASWGAGTSYTYTASGSTSSAGHQVQFQFNWGDGTNSGWLASGTASASHSWAPGTFTVTVQARCVTDNSVTSVASAALTVTITESITTPTVAGTASGGAGTSYTYTASGATSSVGHAVHTSSPGATARIPAGSPAGTASASHSWSSAGSYAVTVQARCVTDNGILSGFSNTIAITMSPPDFTLSLNTALQAVIASGDAATYTATVGAVNGFNGPVTFQTAGVPGGSSITFTDPVTGSSGPITGSGTRTITIATTLPGYGGAIGAFGITVTARSGTLAHSVTLNLTVQGFSVTTSKSTIHVNCTPGAVTSQAKAVGTHGLMAPVHYTFGGFWLDPAHNTQWAPGFGIAITEVDSQTSNFTINMNPYPGACAQQVLNIKLTGLSDAGPWQDQWVQVLVNYPGGGTQDYRVTPPMPTQTTRGTGPSSTRFGWSRWPDSADPSRSRRLGCRRV